MVTFIQIYVNRQQLISKNMALKTLKHFLTILLLIYNITSNSTLTSLAYSGNA